MAISLQWRLCETGNSPVKGYGVSSSTVVSAFVPLALHNCPVLLPSLSVYLTADAPPSRAHTATHPKLSNSTIEKHTIHTLPTGREKSLFERLLLAFVPHCVRERLCWEWGPVRILLTGSLLQELLGRNTNPWNKFETPGSFYSALEKYILS